MQNTIDVGLILYESGYIFQDIDHDGDEEIIEFSISNGQLKDYIIYVLEPEGLKKVNSRKWLRLLKKTDAYINLLAHSQIGCHKND